MPANDHTNLLQPLYSTGEKLERELHVFGIGTLQGIVEAAQDAWSRPLGSGAAEKMLSAIAVGGAFALLSGGRGFLAPTLAKTFGVSMGTAFVCDLINPERIGTIRNAWTTTWNAPSHMAEATESIKKPLGQFAFDTALYSFGGSLGSRCVQLGNRMRIGSVIQRLTETGETSWARKYGNTLKSEFDSFLVSECKKSGLPCEQFVLNKVRHTTNQQSFKCTAAEFQSLAQELGLRSFIEGHPMFSKHLSLEGQNAAFATARALERSAGVLEGMLHGLKTPKSRFR